VEELRDWKVDRGDIRADSGIAREILEFTEQHQVRSIAMTDGIIGVPTRKGSIAKANGARFANFSTEEIGLRGRKFINLRKLGGGLAADHRRRPKIPSAALAKHRTDRSYERRTMLPSVIPAKADTHGCDRSRPSPGRQGNITSFSVT
jgi:hypothetical protein